VPYGFLFTKQQGHKIKTNTEHVTHKRDIKCIQNFRRSEGMKPCYTPKQRLEDNIEMNLKCWIHVAHKAPYRSKAIPVQAWTGPEVSMRLGLPDFMTIGTRWW
jgi:hypothetical protein